MNIHITSHHNTDMVIITSHQRFEDMHPEESSADPGHIRDVRLEETRRLGQGSVHQEHLDQGQEGASCCFGLPPPRHHFMLSRGSLNTQQRSGTLYAAAQLYTFVEYLLLYNKMASRYRESHLIVYKAHSWSRYSICSYVTPTE